MKALSIWNPFALLIVKGFKVFETRTWAPPRSIIGQRIAIASTKTIRPEQKAHFADPNFQYFYERLGLPAELSDLPHGYVLGTAVVDSVELMTAEMLEEEVSNEEQSYGWWEEGNFAWRLRDAIEFPEPIAVRGAQGLYEWSLPHVAEEGRGASGEERSQSLRRHLQTAEREGNVYRLPQAVGDVPRG